MNNTRPTQYIFNNAATALPNAFVQSLLLLYLFLRQFYFQSSGSLQIADAILMLAGLATIYGFLSSPHNYLKAFRKLNLLILTTFILFSIVINIIYALFLNVDSILTSSAYLIYNFLVLLVFAKPLKQPRFRHGIAIVSVLGIATQFLIFILGLGRDFGGGSRYMGTFNDPNQFAFYIFANTLLFFIIGESEVSWRTRKFFKIIVLGTSFLLISASGSTGVVLGLGIFCGLIAMWYFGRILSSFMTQRRIGTPGVIGLALILIGLAGILGLTGLFAPVGEVIVNNIEGLTSRLSAKTSSLSEDSLSLLRDRQYSRIFEHPQYLLFGAGEGAYFRFTTSDFHLEIHSTFLSLLFSYGILPVVFLLAWIVKNLKSATGVIVRFALIALFMESMTLVNHRQPLFWLLFALPPVLASLTESNRNEHHKREKNEKRNANTNFAS